MGQEQITHGATQTYPALQKKTVMAVVISSPSGRIWQEWF